MNGIRRFIEGYKRGARSQHETSKDTGDSYSGYLLQLLGVFYLLLALGGLWLIIFIVKWMWNHS
jgi:hypothetical protein